MENFIKSIDKYAIKPSLKIQGNDEFNTLSGGIFSILTYLITLGLLIFFFIIQMILNKSGTMVSYYQYLTYSNYSSIRLGDELFFSIFAADSNFEKVNFDPELIKIQIIQNYIYASRSTKSKNLTFISPIACQLSSNNDYLNQIKMLMKFNPLCFYDNSTLNIGGNIIQSGNMYNSLMYIGPSDSANSDPRIMQKYISLINSINLFNLIIGFQMPQVVNFTQPIINVTQIIPLIINNSYTFTFQFANFSSFENYIPNMEPTFNKKFPIFTQKSISKSTGNSISINFSIDDSNLIVNRQIYTIDFFIAKFVTINNLVVLIFSILNNFIGEKYYYFHLFNKFFRFHSQYELKTSKTLVTFQKNNNQLIEKFNNEEVKKSLDVNSLCNNFIDKYLDLKDKEFYYNPISMIFSRSKVKKEVFESYKFLFDNCVSVESIFNCVSDIKRFKKLFFNKNQVKLFDYYYSNDYTSESIGYKPSDFDFKKEDFLSALQDDDDFFNNKIVERLISLVESDLKIN